MPVFTQTSETAALYPSDILVGDNHLIVDRPLEASKTFAAFGLVVRDESTGYFRPTTAYRIDSTAWAVDTATDVGDVVIPKTRPVTVSADAGNTGDGTVTAAAAKTAKAGLWRAVCVAEASNAGTFRLIDPAGEDLGAVTVAVEKTLGGLTLTIDDGAADWDKGDEIEVLVGDLHYYTATAVAGDTKTHATTEPTWPTNGTTVVDDQVTWTDSGVVEELRSFTQHGVLLVASAMTTAAAAHPEMPVVLSGLIDESEVAQLPAAYVADTRLGDLIFA